MDGGRAIQGNHRNPAPCVTHILDNVIFNALNTRQAAFAQTHGSARRFVPDVGPLSGFEQPDDAGYNDLAQLAGSGGTVGLFLKEKHLARVGWSVIADPPLTQMIFTPKTIEIMASEAKPLSHTDAPEMLALATEVKPGPFGSRTHELGQFFGVRVNGKLVAMAGERMKLPGYTEVSAVCTQADHLGKGYAGACMRLVIEGILKRGETPFLHSMSENTRALELYSRLGFTPRWQGYVAVLRRD